MEEEKLEVRKIISEIKLEGKINSVKVSGTFRTGGFDSKEIPRVEMIIKGEKEEMPIIIPMDLIGDSLAIEGMLLNQTASYERVCGRIGFSMYTNQKLIISSGQLKGNLYEQPV